VTRFTVAAAIDICLAESGTLVIPRLYFSHLRISEWKHEWRSASLAYVQLLVVVPHGGHPVVLEVPPRPEYAQLVVRHGSSAVLHFVGESNSVLLSLLVLQTRNLVHNDHHQISMFEYGYNRGGRYYEEPEH